MGRRKLPPPTIESVLEKLRAAGLPLREVGLLARLKKLNPEFAVSVTQARERTKQVGKLRRLIDEFLADERLVGRPEHSFLERGLVDSLTRTYLTDMRHAATKLVGLQTLYAMASDEKLDRLPFKCRTAGELAMFLRPHLKWKEIAVLAIHFGWTPTAGPPYTGDEAQIDRVTRSLTVNYAQTAKKKFRKKTVKTKTLNKQQSERLAALLSSLRSRAFLRKTKRIKSHPR